MSKIASIIKYEGDNSTFIWKHPCEDFNTLTQLVVHETQEAIFFLNGQALDTFGPGRHTLTTENIPIIGKLLNRTTNGETPFHCEVYFINKTVQMSIKWGTDSKVRFIEPNYNLPIEIGASGEMNLQVSNSRKLLLKLVGTMNGIAWNDGSDTGTAVHDGVGNFAMSLRNSFRPLISMAVKTNLASAIKREAIDLLDVDENLEKLAFSLKEAIEPEFEEYGLSIPQFYLTTVLLPENDPNFRRIRDLHAISLQAKAYEAETFVRTAKAESEAKIYEAEGELRKTRAETDAAVIALQRKMVMEQQTTKTEVARQEAQRTMIEAQAKAEAEKLKGFSEAAVMQAKGYNEKDVIQADVQKAYAESLGNINISGNAGGVTGDIMGLGIGMAAASAVVPQMGEMLKGFSGANGIAGNNSDVAGKVTSKCPSCGFENPEGAKFCLNCGNKIEKLSPDEIICPSCGKKTPKGKFCIECGFSLISKCSVCGKELAPEAKFCPECGTKQ